MKRITYELQGECIRCGECCRGVDCTYLTQGKVKDAVCEHLTSEKINGVEVAVCGMHGNFWRAHACVNYPVSPTAHDLPKGCGYKWVIVKEEIT